MKPNKYGLLSDTLKKNPARTAGFVRHPEKSNPAEDYRLLEDEFVPLLPVPEVELLPVPEELEPLVSMEELLSFLLCFLCFFLLLLDVSPDEL